jgi:hypothetical protein
MHTIEFGETLVAKLREPTREERIAGVEMKYRIADLPDGGGSELVFPFMHEAESHLVAMTESLQGDGMDLLGEEARDKAKAMALYFEEGVRLFIGLTFRERSRIASGNGDLGSGSAEVRLGAGTAGKPSP